MNWIYHESEAPVTYYSLMTERQPAILSHKSLVSKTLQSNFNGLNTFGTMKISSRQG